MCLYTPRSYKVIFTWNQIECVIFMIKLNRQIYTHAHTMTKTNSRRKPDQLFIIFFISFFDTKWQWPLYISQHTTSIKSTFHYGSHEKCFILTWVNCIPFSLSKAKKKIRIMNYIPHIYLFCLKFNIRVYECDVYVYNTKKKKLWIRENVIYFIFEGLVCTYSINL